MIIRIRHKGLRELFETGRSKRIDVRFHNKIIDLLDMLDAATGPKDLVRVADFHGLIGDRQGQYSMHVNGNWVLTFRFDDGGVVDVDFEDYH
ncbi:putative Plasmid maintenance system killer [Magnetospirillum gryphiswaldense MSR-1 v2]|uniref:Plasmid maintenance system killer n=1 Tax=Magnetospirillum gryphiswaldense (strain DSM 6361 / JCM 21280 / NBRC 15271 / MSR-1) TaxID=431944 RepID=V6F911_MAGGM|nr:type II toxin-antitoxin system RelE/ParE family toxin [Magnetospirillum gryphiswaldense]CDL01443.1 putative Plasmid maintenance system killer [Magnetospirillum gryphiswaldense MSR-1 v2]